MQTGLFDATLQRLIHKTVADPVVDRAQDIVDGLFTPTLTSPRYRSPI